MRKVQKLIFLSSIYAVLFWSTVGDNLRANETDFFDQKDESFWVIKNKQSFIEASKELIDDEGNWKGNPPIPQYIKYSQELTEEDLPVLERWLSLKGLDCFAIADTKAEPNISLINSWYSDLEDTGEDLEKRNFYKLAWLNFKTTLNELERGAQSILPAPWVETNRAFQMKNSHYRTISSH
ncbi:hypothetical protein [Candidatus Odyssella acanthamoebae]|uniref:Uncharacterized protein n=1 Tax=Candidatus Odyssella acanthamoebae TaxID=91604 RepID=A0A077AX16_9PROT|nr:hypothetical protein [Candidatus Paracaedibacter acanthamoebae]AIK96168.1 hypothetical protein ID47_04535 [Candidatus Paracaedibacter acanthamoebae]